MKQPLTLRNGIFTVIVPAFATSALLTLPVASRAQTPVPGLTVEIGDGSQNQFTTSSPPSLAPISIQQSNVSGSSYSIAGYGLLGGQTIAPSSSNGGDNISTSYFIDKITVTDGNPLSTAMLAVNGTTSVFGNYVLNDNSANTGSSGFQQLVEAQVLNSSGNVIGSGLYQYDIYTNDGGTTNSYMGGSLNFSATIADNSSFYLKGELNVVTESGNGGYAEADYQNTAVFNLTSTNPNTTFIGSSGTNYSTISDSGTSAASAPEPASAALLVPLFIPMAFGWARRRRIARNANA